MEEMRICRHTITCQNYLTFYNHRIKMCRLDLVRYYIRIPIITAGANCRVELYCTTSLQFVRVRVGRGTSLADSLLGVTGTE